MDSIKILGVKVDKVTYQDSLSIISNYIQSDKKAYIVTPNVEIVMAALEDFEFKKVLNKAKLSIPDSSRLWWAYAISSRKSLIDKILLWPFFLLLKAIPGLRSFPVTTGTRLMDQLISLSEEKAYTIGLLGGRDGVADKLRECLMHKYPKLKIKFCSSNITVDLSGNSQFDIYKNIKYKSKNIKDLHHRKPGSLNVHKLSEKMDILFVALGHIKQEKWMSKNLPKLNTKVMIGVGGAFDYLSGTVSRAPGWVQEIGLEWLFRLIIQPWRIKRFGSLVKFIFKVSFGKN